MRALILAVPVHCLALPALLALPIVHCLHCPRFVQHPLPRYRNTRPKLTQPSLAPSLRRRAVIPPTRRTTWLPDLPDLPWNALLSPDPSVDVILHASPVQYEYVPGTGYLSRGLPGVTSEGTFQGPRASESPAPQAPKCMRRLLWTDDGPCQRDEHPRPEKPTASSSLRSA